MESHVVDLLLEPFNDGKNTFPVLRVDDQVYAYDLEGLRMYTFVRNYFLVAPFKKIDQILFLYNCVATISTYWFVDKSRNGSSQDGKKCCCSGS